MKRGIFTSCVIAFVIALSGCQKGNDNLTGAQKETVRQEVSQAFNSFYSACNSLNLSILLGSLSESPDFRFIDVEGKVTDAPTTRTNFSQMINSFASSKYETQKIEITPITNVEALLLWHGSAVCNLKDGTQLKFNSVGWTILYQRQKGAWKIQHFQESAPPPLSIPKAK